MIEITLSEFEKNFDYYSFKVQDVDIMVTDNGKSIMKIENPNKDRISVAKSLKGCIETFDENIVLEEKLRDL